MKSFDDWLREPLDPPASSSVKRDGDSAVIVSTLGWENDELELYNDIDEEEENLVYPCNVCGRFTSINCTAEEFDPSMCYCGRGPSCCP